MDLNLKSLFLTHKQVWILILIKKIVKDKWSSYIYIEFFNHIKCFTLYSHKVINDVIVQDKRAHYYINIQYVIKKKF